MAGEGAWSDAEPRRHGFEFPAGERPAAAITEAVTWFGDADEGDLEPLAAAVDLEWLSALFAYRRGGDRPSDAASGPSLSFEYGGCLVTVEPGRFAVEPAATPRPRRPVEAAGD